MDSILNSVTHVYMWGSFLSHVAESATGDIIVYRRMSPLAQHNETLIFAFNPHSVHQFTTQIVLFYKF